MQAIQTVVWHPIDLLTEWSENPNEGDVGQIVESILTFGFVDELNFYYKEVMAGNHRLKAVHEIRRMFNLTERIEDVESMLLRSTRLRIQDGVWELGGSDISHFPSREEAMSYALANNKTNRMGRDNPAQLLSVIQAIQQSDPSLLPSSGYDVETVTDLIDQVDNEATRRDAEALARAGVTIDEPTHVVEYGDVWKVGKHILICADVVVDHWRWIKYLADGTWFLPYPGVYAAMTERALEMRFVMVQPDSYIAGHILDKFAEQFEGEVIEKQE